MKQLVIFDLDGTLVNSIADLGTAANHALTRMGYPVHRLESYPMMVGNGITRLLERALPDEARRPRVIEALRQHFKEYYNDHLWTHTTVYPGIADLLDELTRRGIAIAVASNKYQDAVTRIVDHFFGQLPWAAVMGQRDGTPVKPDPSVVFAILNQHPTPKADTLYVGDSGVDIETARRACIDNVGVTWGFRSRSELARAYADHIVDNPDDILSLI